MSHSDLGHALRKRAYFIVTVHIDEPEKRPLYDAYIGRVKPIVERHGGRYLVRTEEITALSGDSPDRVIVIEFPDQETLKRCFASAEYREIAMLREQAVRASAIIVEECES